MEGVVTSSPDDVRFWDGRQLLVSVSAVENPLRRRAVFGLFRSSNHEEARWLCQMFPSGIAREGVAEARERFLAVEGKHQAAALCYAGMIDEKNLSMDLVQQAAHIGYSFAFAVLYLQEGSVDFVRRGAKLGDRFCMSLLGQIETGSEKRTELFKQAERMGDWIALNAAARYVSEKNPLHWLLLKKYASYVYADFFIRKAKKMLEVYWSSEKNADVLFTIGECLKDACIERRVAEPFLNLREEMLAVVRVEIVNWSLCAKRLGLMKDMQVVIAKMIWESRIEGRLV